MSKNFYDIETYMAEIYDQSESYDDDIRLIKQNIGNDKKIKILEPFCGTGRISIPLAVEGHSVIGFDLADRMIKWLKTKIKDMAEINNNIEVFVKDVFEGEWTSGFDLIILGCNCFYELATPNDQERCIELASNSINKGGYLFIDSDHMEGELHKSWQNIGGVGISLKGTSEDGSEVETKRETIWFDKDKRLARFKYKTKVIKPSGEVIENEFIQQKHPVSTYELKNWLNKYGFEVEKLYGDTDGSDYTDNSRRAIFWARKK